MCSRPGLGQGIRCLFRLRSDQCPLTLRHEQRQQWWRMGKTRANDGKRPARRCSLFQFSIVAFAFSFCLSIPTTKKDMYPALNVSSKMYRYLPYHLEMAGVWGIGIRVVWRPLGFRGTYWDPYLIGASNNFHAAHHSPMCHSQADHHGKHQSCDLCESQWILLGLGYISCPI